MSLYGKMSLSVDLDLFFLAIAKMFAAILCVCVDTLTSGHMIKIA